MITKRGAQFVKAIKASQADVPVHVEVTDAEYIEVPTWEPGTDGTYDGPPGYYETTCVRVEVVETEAVVREPRDPLDWRATRAKLSREARFFDVEWLNKFLRQLGLPEVENLSDFRPNDVVGREFDCAYYWDYVHEMQGQSGRLYSWWIPGW